jgi:hypothetical protein
MMSFAAWILKLMTVLALTERVTPDPRIADAIAAAAEERPLAGEHGRERMAAILVALGWTESRYNVDAVGDHGQSVGAFQLSKAWHPPPDVEGQAKRAAWLVEESFRVCSRKPLGERLSFYAAGGAACAESGAPASRWRMHLAAMVVRANPMPDFVALR